ncbi:MAG: adenosylmethionine--8-amino-7-oxononanoate transaminase [Verrucomicrobia bacterium]|nr:adenosylmethionine--8-amino-7-oxononanoate transaminase [Verrucomicrobiota bacterium]
MTSPPPWDAWDRQHAWHPYTQSAEAALYPALHIARGEGPWLFDTADRRYLDGHSSLWTNVHGHRDPDLDAALRTQLDQVAHATWLGLSHPTASTLAATLARLAGPGLARVFFSDNGSCAVEVALKLSRQFWQLSGQPEKREVVGFAGGYHGDTLATMAVGDSADFHGRFADWFLPAHHVPAPHCLEMTGTVREAESATSLRALRELFTARAAHIAAVVLESSVQGAAGMRQQPPDFIAAVAALCREHGVHLILDEVFVAFGRLGHMLVGQQEGVTPDFLCLAKGLTGGYLPLAATLTSDRIHDAFCGAFEENRTFFHGHTFTANPLAAAVACATVEKLERLLADGTLRARVAAFGNAFAKSFAEHPQAANPRQRGFTAAFDLVPDAHSPQVSFPPSARIGLQVCLEARRRGLILRQLGSTLAFVPPPCCTENEFRFLCETTLAAMNAVFARPGGPHTRFADFAARFDPSPPA